MENSSLQSKPKSNVRLTTLLFFCKQAPRDRKGNPVVEIMESRDLGFFYAFKN